MLLAAFSQHIPNILHRGGKDVIWWNKIFFPRTLFLKMLIKNHSISSSSCKVPDKYKVMCFLLAALDLCLIPEVPTSCKITHNNYLHSICVLSDCSPKAPLWKASKKIQSRAHATWYTCDYCRYWFFLVSLSSRCRHGPIPFLSHWLESNS